MKFTRSDKSAIGARSAGGGVGRLHTAVVLEPGTIVYAHHYDTAVFLAHRSCLSYLLTVSPDVVDILDLCILYICRAYNIYIIKS